MPKKQSPASRKPHDEFSFIDDGARAATAAHRAREAAEYDGVLGMYPKCFPENFQRSFLSARNLILDEGHDPKSVLEYIHEQIQMEKFAIEHPEVAYYRPTFVLQPKIFSAVRTLAELWTAYNMGPEKGLAFLMGPSHAQQLVKGQRFSTGGRSKKGKEYEPKKSIREICETIQSTTFEKVIEFLRDEDKCSDLYESTKHPIDVKFDAVDDETEQVSYMKRGDSPAKMKHISFRRLRNILLEIK